MKRCFLFDTLNLSNVGELSLVDLLNAVVIKREREFVVVLFTRLDFRLLPVPVRAHFPEQRLVMEPICSRPP